MVEREYYDERFVRRDKDYYVPRRSASGLGAFLLAAMIPVAFITGWVVSANANPQGGGFEAGVGGGPDSNEKTLISPLPENPQLSPTLTITPTPTTFEINVSPTPIRSGPTVGP